MNYKTLGLVLASAALLTPGLRAQSTEQPLDVARDKQIVADAAAAMGGRDRILAVKTLVAHIRGEKVERTIDTGVHLITRDTMDQPEMKALLTPDLSQWLK